MVKVTNQWKPNFRVLFQNVASNELSKPVSNKSTRFWLKNSYLILIGDDEKLSFIAFIWNSFGYI